MAMDDSYSTLGKIRDQDRKRFCLINLFLVVERKKHRIDLTGNAMVLATIDDGRLVMPASRQVAQQGLMLGSMQ